MHVHTSFRPVNAPLLANADTVVNIYHALIFVSYSVIKLVNNEQMWSVTSNKAKSCVV